MADDTSTDALREAQIVAEHTEAVYVPSLGTYLVKDERGRWVTIADAPEPKARQ